MIDIQLENPAVKVGEWLTGQLILTPKDQTVPKKASAAIGWRTEGRGSVNRETVQDIQLEPSRFMQGMPSRIPIQFQIPIHGPISYNGSLIRIRWELSIHIDLPGLFRFDDRESQLFYVLPR